MQFEDQLGRFHIFRKVNRNLVTTDMLMTKKSFFFIHFKHSMRNTFYQKMGYTEIFLKAHLKLSQKKY